MSTKPVHTISAWASIISILVTFIIFFSARPYFKDWFPSNDKNSNHVYSNDSVKPTSTFIEPKKTNINESIDSLKLRHDHQIAKESTIPSSQPEKKPEVKIIPCTQCNGNGTIKIKKACDACSGTGIVTCTQCSGTGKWGNIYPTKGIYETPACSLCSGSGKIKCASCLGKGEVTIVTDCSKCNGTGQITNL